MRKIISLTVMLIFMIQLAGCGVEDMMGAVFDRAPESSAEENTVVNNTGQANTTLSESTDEEYTPIIPQDAEKPKEETAPSGESQTDMLGEERIFYDNSQTAYYFLSSPQYVSICHTVFQSEAVSAPKAYTLKIKDGSFDSAGNLIGYLHWQDIGYDSLRSGFADRNLYTFAQNGEIPKLDDKGPLALIFEDKVLDPDNLNIIFTDLMENNFGAPQIAARFADLLTEKEGVELRLFQFDCEGFNGNMSFPSYSASGTSVSTVEKYRGSAAMYIVAVGPTQEVEDFAARLRTNLPGNITFNEAVYANGESFPGYTGINEFELVESLDRQMANGNCGTLNYTVNARPTEGSEGRFEYNTDHTVDDTDFKITFYSEIAADSPLVEDENTKIRIENITVNGEGAKPEHGISIELEVKESLPVRTDGKADGYISEVPGLCLTVRGKKPAAESITSVNFDLVADMGNGDQWIEAKSATIYEFQSVVCMLPKSDTAENRLVWRAGATDILSRTLDLADVNSIIGSSVTNTKIIDSISLDITGPADKSGRWNMAVYAVMGGGAAGVIAVLAITLTGSGSRRKRRRR